MFFGIIIVNIITAFSEVPMKLIAPVYYNKFHCIADKCRHSCCVGWEIDIDGDTYDFYKKHNGALKERFEKSISREGVPHFILDNMERCPFLNGNNLCDIYTELGEDALCRICTDHPRFRNFYSNQTEIGLGLCCEEACRIILSENDFSLMIIDDDGKASEMTEDEKYLLEIRDNVFSVIGNADLSVYERFERVLRGFGIRVELNNTSLKALFSSLEYMENDISLLITDSCNVSDKYLERLAFYFIFRHLSDSLDDGLLAVRVVFAYACVMAVTAMCESDDFEEICENARIFSSEIEYSEENVDEILNRVGDLIEVLD